MASVRALDNSEVSVTDPTYAASAIREAGMKPRPCRIGRVACVQENFSGCKCARGMPCTRDFTHIRYEQYGLSYLLVTLLRCTANCTAYPIQAALVSFPQKEGSGLKGLGWRFSNIDRESVEGMNRN